MSLRAIPLLAVVVLYANDHWWKQAYPGFVTGKLSDIAGMIVAPLALHALMRMIAPKRSDALLVGACVATAIVFALVKTVPAAMDAYRLVWGFVEWPLRAARAIAHGHTLPVPRHVNAVRDPGDLLAVPFAWVAWHTGRGRVPACAMDRSRTVRNARVSGVPGLAEGLRK